MHSGKLLLYTFQIWVLMEKCKRRKWMLKENHYSCCLRFVTIHTEKIASRSSGQMRHMSSVGRGKFMVRWKPNKIPKRTVRSTVGLSQEKSSTCLNTFAKHCKPPSVKIFCHRFRDNFSAATLCLSLSLPLMNAATETWNWNSSIFLSSLDCNEDVSVYGIFLTLDVLFM